MTPQFKVGDMWSAYASADLFCITTNACVTQFDRLVMGRGIAKEARDSFPDLDYRFGTNLVSRQLHLGKYGLLVDSFTHTAALQVKYHWRDKADPDLISFSIGKLVEYLEEYDAAEIHLNFPGIGNGGLARAAVLPLLDVLPNYVTIWELRA